MIIKKICHNVNVKDEMNIVFKSYSDALITCTEKIEKWLEKIKKEGE